MPPIPLLMHLRPTPESRRVAIWTAIGAAAIATASTFAALSGMRVAWIWWPAVAAAIATLLPAVNTLTTRVAVNDDAITVRSFGRTHRFEWRAVADVHVIERRASVPDGTEYHWFAVQRAPHVVAVPCLELVDGDVRELPMLASRAAGDGPRVADQNAERISRARPASTSA